MLQLESVQQFSEVLAASHAILFLDFVWSGQAQRSGAVITEWEQTWALWNPNVHTQIWRALPDAQPWFAEWIPKDGDELAGGGRGSVLWLRHGRVVGYVPAAYLAGVRELARKTDELFGGDGAPR